MVEHADCDLLSLSGKRHLLQELQGTNGDSKVMLEVELPEFPHAVIYQQAAVLPGPGPSPLAAVQVWNILRRSLGMAKIETRSMCH